MILIDATYVNIGGGIGLLRRVINELRGRAEFTLLRDIRAKDLDTAGCQVLDAVPNHFARRRFYQVQGRDFSRVLCFGNVPPLVRLPVPTATYFHNLLFCEEYPHQSARDRYIARMKMAYIRHYARNTDTFLVQTANMVSALQPIIAGRSQIAVQPFFAFSRSAFPLADTRQWDQFAYVSEAHPHKNHHRLLGAWRLLLARGLRPSLHLTVTSAYPVVLAEIATLQAAGARITNHGYAPPAPIYAQCGYQIYPSLVESFGLGLIEAADARCAVLAAARPYVRAVVEPFAVFDPCSSESIADLVAKCSGHPAPASITKVQDDLAGMLGWLSEGTPFQGQQT